MFISTTLEFAPAGKTLLLALKGARTDIAGVENNRLQCYAISQWMLPGLQGGKPQQE